jgi:polysaccharide export outer membrane protein
MRFLVLVWVLVVSCGMSGLATAAAPAGDPASPPVAPAAATPASATAAQAPPPAAASAPSSDDTSQTYILGPSDVIEVSVLGRPDFTTKGRIGEDGNLKLPYLGSVKVSDRTAAQLSDDLAKALLAGGYYVHPIVKVDIVSYASRYVTVLGNVTTPGLVPVDRPYRLSEIMARVGGVKETGADYVVFRPKQGAERHISIEALATGDLNEDPYVSPGDKIYSPEAELFYVSGQVKSPGGYPMKPNLTMRMAVSRAGGVTDAGSLSSITVTRAGKKLTHVDLDSKVMSGDVLVIGERLF